MTCHNEDQDAEANLKPQTKYMLLLPSSVFLHLVGFFPATQ